MHSEGRHAAASGQAHLVRERGCLSAQDHAIKFSSYSKHHRSRADLCGAKDSACSEESCTGDIVAAGRAHVSPRGDADQGFNAQLLLAIGCARYERRVFHLRIR